MWSFIKRAWFKIPILVRIYLWFLFGFTVAPSVPYFIQGFIDNGNTITMAMMHNWLLYLVGLVFIIVTASFILTLLFMGIFIFIKTKFFTPKVAK